MTQYWSLLLVLVVAVSAWSVVISNCLVRWDWLCLSIADGVWIMYDRGVVAGCTTWPGSTWSCVWTQTASSWASGGWERTLYMMHVIVWLLLLLQLLVFLSKGCEVWPFRSQDTRMLRYVGPELSPHQKLWRTQSTPWHWSTLVR